MYLREALGRTRTGSCSLMMSTYFFPQTEMCDFAMATRADGP
jgi:hypothetical protein